MDEQDWKTLIQWIGGYIGLWIIVGIVSMLFFHVSFIKVFFGGFGILLAVGLVLIFKWAINNKQ